MRRLLFLLVALSLVIPATAQMRGTRGGVGFRGGVGVRVAPSRGPIIRTVPPFRGFNGFGFRHFPRHRFNRFNCFNGFCNGFGFNGFGFNSFGFGAGLPLYVGSYDSGFTGAAYTEDTRRYDDTRDREVNELLQDIRDQQRQLDYLINNLQNQQQYAPQQQQQPQQAPGPRGSMLRQQMRGSTVANTAPNQPATTLVFKDGRHMDVQNYVIAKDRITILDGGTRQHFALSQIDIPATQKVNADRGVDFKAPTVSVSLLCNPSDPNISCRPHRTMTESQRALTP